MGTYNVYVRLFPHAVGRKDSQNRVYFKLSVDTLTCLRGCATLKGWRGILRDRPVHNLMIFIKGEREKEDEMWGASI